MKVKFEMKKEALERAAAIPWGSWKLFFGGLWYLFIGYGLGVIMLQAIMGITVLFSGGTLAGFEFFFPAIANLSESKVIANVIGFSVTAIVFSCLVFRKRRFLEDYWRCNIISYNYYIGLDQMFVIQGNDSCPVEQIIQYRFADNINMWEKEDRLIISLSLGGLFRSRAGIYWRCSYWSAKIIQFPPRDDFFLIRLYDGKGNSQAMSPQTAMSLVADYIRNYGGWPETLGHLISDLECQCDKLTQKLKENQEQKTRICEDYNRQISALCLKVEGLANLALETITAIAKTSRFKDSKEGQKIRRVLSERLRIILPKNHVCLRDMDAIEAVKPSGRSKEAATV